MKLDRRGFIKFLVGGALGTMVTPIPWKLIDDVAIWTQNWPWVPNPSNGESSFRTTMGPFQCPGNGASVRLIDGKRAVTMAGVPDNPISQGGLDAMDVSALQYHYNENVRVTSPMVADQGMFRPISWEEGINLLVGKLTEIRDKGTPERVALIDGSPPGTAGDLLRRFLSAYGSPNYMTMPSAADTENQILKLMYGAQGTMGYDLENADFVVGFGCDLLEGWGSQRSILAFRSRRGNGAQDPVTLVQVATNASMTSSHADEWVAVAPGTEGALALGMAHVLLKKGLVNSSFAANMTFGLESGTSGKTSFSGFKELLMRRYDPATVSGITGVPAGKIEDLAQRFARAKRPLALPGRGKGEMPGGIQEFMAVHSLNALVGAVYRQGGVAPVPAPPLAPWAEVQYDAVAERGLRTTRVDQAGSRYPFAESLLHVFAEELANDRASVDMLVVHRANPAHNAPSSKAFNRALDKIPFVVSFCSYWNETTNRAHLVLPEHSFLERWEDGTTPPTVPFPVYLLGGPVLPPLYDTRQAGDIVLQTAKALGGSVAGSLPWNSYEDVIKARVAGLFDSQTGVVAAPGTLGKAASKGFASAARLWKALKENGCWYDAGLSVGRTPARFGTPSGKFEFYSNGIRSGLERTGRPGPAEAACMASYEPVEPEGSDRTYPYLMMPENLAYVYEGEVPSAPYMTKIWPDTLLKGIHLVVQINPETASHLHLREGDKATLESLRGQAEVRVHLFHGIRPGIVAMAEGFGHTAFDEYIRGKGSNTRDLTTVSTDPLSGMPLWWATRVKLTKV